MVWAALISSVLQCEISKNTEARTEAWLSHLVVLSFAWALGQNAGWLFAAGGTFILRWNACVLLVINECPHTLPESLSTIPVPPGNLCSSGKLPLPSRGHSFADAGIRAISLAGPRLWNWLPVYTDLSVNLIISRALGAASPCSLDQEGCCALHLLGTMTIRVPVQAAQCHSDECSAFTHCCNNSNCFHYAFWIFSNNKNWNVSGPTPFSWFPDHIFGTGPAEVLPPLNICLVN